MTHDNLRYVKREDYNTYDGQHVRSVWFSFPKQDDQDFDPTIASVFYERERAVASGWSTDGITLGFSIRGHTFSLCWGRQ